MPFMPPLPKRPAPPKKKSGTSQNADMKPKGQQQRSTRLPGVHAAEGPSSLEMQFYRADILDLPDTELRRMLSARDTAPWQREILRDVCRERSATGSGQTGGGTAFEAPTQESSTDRFESFYRQDPGRGPDAFPQQTDGGKLASAGDRKSEGILDWLESADEAVYKAGGGYELTTADELVSGNEHDKVRKGNPDGQFNIDDMPGVGSSRSPSGLANPILAIVMDLVDLGMKYMEAVDLAKKLYGDYDKPVSGASKDGQGQSTSANGQNSSHGNAYLGIGVELLEDKVKPYGASRMLEGGGDTEAARLTFQGGDRWFWVRNLFPGGPAEKAGLLEGDILLEINGHKAVGKSVTLAQILGWLRGEYGRKVPLIVTSLNQSSDVARRVEVEVGVVLNAPVTSANRV